jgi:hypothetical protein
MNEQGDDLVEDNPMAAPMRPRGDVWEQTKQRAGRARERTQLFVRENPIPMMIGAFAAGLAIGLAIRLTSDSESKIKPSVRRSNWTLLPFLWPAVKFMKENYESSAETVKENVDRYTEPIRKRWKSWAH